MPGGGDRTSRGAKFATAERDRNAAELYLRGATFEQIARQLGFDRTSAQRAWQRVLKRTPVVDIEAMRKAQASASSACARRSGLRWPVGPTLQIPPA
jgi:hypothetical protein